MMEKASNEGNGPKQCASCRLGHKFFFFFFLLTNFYRFYLFINGKRSALRQKGPNR
jgi:hypothetical protein